MEIEILKSSKEEVEVEINSLTIAEILRVYLNKDSNVTFAAWKREHPTKNPVLLVQTKGKTAKKALNDAINSITKELDRIESDFSKMK
jgi:DNA-directed RNA polymerase subunit L